jgi:hypothetical protein
VKSSRREFLKTTGRFAVLGAFVYAGARLFRRTSFRLGETCINASICRGCTVYTDCGLPQALSAKQARGEG